MEILTYVQARNEMGEGLSEEQAQMVLTVSGRAKEWVGKIAKIATDPARTLLVGKDLVEASGMGRSILQNIPKEEWVYLVNPSLAPQGSQVVEEQIVVEGKLFSVALRDWLMAQEIGMIYQLVDKELTEEEAKIMRLLWTKQESVVEREAIAESIWGSGWSSKYSDWGIDALVHRVRSKLSGKWQIVTIKGRGYLLAGTEKLTRAPQVAMARNERTTEIPGSIYPSDEYLRYMNDPKKLRKVYRDLFRAVKAENILSSRAKSRDPSTAVGMTEKIVGMTSKILCINSYSYDNVDAVAAWAPKAKIYFVHYDPRALELHRERVRELGLQERIEVLHDDMRESKLKSETFDIVINDFRLNFNQDDKQNRAMMGHTLRVMREGGVALISTVVDGRYENARYGIDQEKAPINVGRPGTFQADEHLVRRCWSIPYYRQLFGKAEFSQIKEFDIEEGKRWEPPYRRWVAGNQKK